MIIENPDVLRVWLTLNLRPLCDADPCALAKYVLALIRKDKPDDELRQGMLEQLDVFLQKETIPFVDRLIEAIQTNTYLELQEPKDGTLYVHNNKPGSMPVPFHELPNPFETSTSSGSSHEQIDRGMNTSLNASIMDSTISSQEGFPDSDCLNLPTDLNETYLSSDSTHRQLQNILGRDDTRQTKLDKDRLGRRKSRSPRNRNRSKSRERGRRSWSPKDYPRIGRYRGTMRRSPTRRNDRDAYDRRRSPRNRSSSPYGRNSAHRYNSRRGGYEPRRIRSPIKHHSRSRSPIPRVNRSDGMDTKGTPAVIPTSPVEQTGRIDGSVPTKEDPVFNSTLANNRCKDFDERGLCMRGELCPFDHGQNPVVLQDVGVTVSGLKRTVQLGESISTPPYRAPEPQEFRVRQTRPLLPMDSELHNPASIAWGQSPFHQGGGPRMRGGLMLRPPVFPVSPRELINVPVIGPPGTQMMEDENNFPPMHNMGLMYQPPHRGGHGRGRSRGRGGVFDHSRLGGKAKVYTNCSLEVKRIPSSQNNISDLNSHFVQFGKIVNIQINFENDPGAALITFSSPNEAYSAYKSTDAVLNNRFIRVFWHNKEKENEEGDDSPVFPRISAKDRLGVLDTSDESMEVGENERILVSGINVTKTVYNRNPQKREISQEKVHAVEAIKKSQEQLAAHEQLKRAVEEKKRETMKLMHDLQKKKQVMLIEQIKQQKKLIHRLENSKAMRPEEKEELMKLVKTLQESIETITKGMDIVAVPSPQRPTPPSQTVQPMPQSQVISTVKGEAIRDILDAELDLYNTELEGGDTVALKRKVAELRSQARSGPYTRGRGGFRGTPPTRGPFLSTRGGSVSRSVDRRPTTIIITGFPSPILPELMAHFAQYGLVPYHKPDYVEPSLTMTYESRKCAETAMVKGRVYKEYKLAIKWVPNTPHKDDYKNCSPPPLDGLEIPDVVEENGEGVEAGVNC